MFLSCLSSSFSVSLFFAAAQSAPTTIHAVRQVANDGLVGYVADPAGRGTASLLISCVLTLILCVWSALHLNVPPPSQTRRQELWTHVSWMVAGIYAPELVVFAAWRQWSSAKVLSTIIENSAVPSVTEEKSYYGNSSWSLTHSFFACTGGFAIDCSPYVYNSGDQRCFLPPDVPRRMTVTGRGIAFLARHGIVPDVRKADIEDKSKANRLAKTLVMVQALWILLQVIGRVASRLPVTLLEINTVAHVLCAFSMYAMWWHKPLTPNEPIILRGDWVESLLAFMYMSSEISGKVDTRQIKSQTAVKTLFASLNLYSKTPEVEELCYRTVGQLQPNSESESPLTSPSKSFFSQHEKGKGYLTPVSETCLKLLQAKRMERKAGTAFFERRPRIQTLHRGDSILEATLARRRLFADCLQTYPGIKEEQISFEHVDGGNRCYHFKTEQMVTDNSRNWPSDDLLRDVGGLVVGMVLWLANLIYGGIHLVAWNDHFPSNAEMWLWRGSATYIGFCGGLWVVLNYLVKSNPRLNDFWERWMDGEKTWLQNISLGTLVFVCGFSLMLARAYIVMEAFVSIRQLPAEAYDTPNWTEVFPHF